MKHAPTPAELAAHAACAEPCNCCTTWNVRLGFPCTCPAWVAAPPVTAAAWLPVSCPADGCRKRGECIHVR